MYRMKYMESSNRFYLRKAMTLQELRYVVALADAGHFGHAGTLSLKVESTTAVDGQKILLRASKASSGDSHMGATVALTMLFGPLGLLKHGNDVKYPSGTKITVYTDQQVTVKVPQ